MHEQMVVSISRAPIRFFDSNPVGRIQTRFSKDMSTLDILLPGIAVFSSNGLWRAICVFCVMMVLQPWLVLVMAVLTVIMVLAFNYTIRAMIQAQRMDSVYRGPINSAITNVVIGLVSIRSYERLQYFRGRFIDDLEKSANATWTYFVTNRLLGFWLDIACVTFCIGVAALTMLWYLERMTPAKLAFALQIICDVSAFFSISIRYIAECQNYMTSSQRVIEYAQMEPEAALVNPEKDTKLLGVDETAIVKSYKGEFAEIAEESVKHEWPSQGAIDFENVTMRYREKLEPSLRGLNFAVEPRMKVGIVGRTGAGKSSILQALFRLVELSDGKIKIDGEDIS